MNYFPEKNESFLKGQDVLYAQFNALNFYVEDVDQENFYYVVLKKLFPDIKFEKIFPLGGKIPVIAEADKNLNDKTKVFLLDLDFDEILSKKVKLPNVFYLKRYSIENYLLEIDAIIEIIKEQRPTIKNHEILREFDLKKFLIQCKDLLKDIICSFITVQRYQLGIENVKADVARFCNLNQKNVVLKVTETRQYLELVKKELKKKDGRLKLESQLKKFNKLFKTIEGVIKGFPGKYLLKLLKNKIEHIFSLSQMALSSFTYRLAKNCNFTDLDYMKIAVGSYIK